MKCLKKASLLMKCTGLRTSNTPNRDKPKRKKERKKKLVIIQVAETEHESQKILKSWCGQNYQLHSIKRKLLQTSCVLVMYWCALYSLKVMVPNWPRWWQVCYDLHVVYVLWTEVDILITHEHFNQDWFQNEFQDTSCIRYISFVGQKADVFFHIFSGSVWRSVGEG